MPDSDPLPDFDDRAPADRYCDLILSGAVTSSVAYPAVIATLATTYRFHSIGGSSSGAGAAALAAAAEYRRRHGSSNGFRTLLERTAAVADVTADPDDTKRLRTGLEWLFQPEPQHTRLFEAMVAGFTTPDLTFSRRIRAMLCQYVGTRVVRIAMALSIVGLAVMLVTLSHSLLGQAAAISAAQSIWAFTGLTALSLLVGLVMAMVLLVAPFLIAGWLFWRDFRCMVWNDFGLCSGHAPEPSKAPRPPLTNWLHALIQEVAGLQPDDPPLTFADLHAAPGGPASTLGAGGRPDAKSIVLQMFTANVSQGRPYLFPQEEGDTPLYFLPAEMRALFPKAVVEHMIRKSPDDRCTNGLWRLPTDQLPVLVAARMSVSFPVLFRAVPLWALDPQAKPPRMRRCLFSDGGLCSNFPIHLFDSPIPAWPTFGLSLNDRPEANNLTPVADLVTLPETEHDGQYERWRDFDDRRATGERFMGFLDAMFGTVIEWNDATLARLPGVWDRVVRVSLPTGVGGLNIRMKKDDMQRLAELGGEAGRRLLERFARPSQGANGLADGWNEHRWVRFNLLHDCLAEALRGVSQSSAQRSFALPMRDQIRAAIDTPPLPRNAASKLQPAQAAALEGVLAALMEAERALHTPAGRPFYPAHPKPKLRVRPPL